ncbi:MAG TPA: lysylphosphatidylglycerol synthase transmembrane domain-containing protein [Dehalococcoidia bacterium]|nr:lysylphosphatidylglycerol synthase transmembrane domain-containing protein [Dehalococcoidia bacterium]
MADGPKAGGVPRRRFPWRSIGLYGLAAVFLSLVVWRSRVWEAGDSFQRVDALTIVVVPLLSLVIAVPLAVRGRAVLAALGHRFSALSLIPVTFYGNTVGFLTPAASGELLRPSLLERGFGVPLARGAAVVLYERLFSMYLMCLTGLLAFTWTGTIPVAASVGLAPVIAALALTPMGIVMAFDLRLGRVGERLPAFIRSRLGGLSGTGDAMDSLWRSPRLAVSFVALSVMVFGVMMLQFWLLVKGTGEDISLTEAWVVLFAANMAGVFSGLPLGLGATDATMVSLLNAYGVDLSAAAAITVLARVLINLPAGIFGLVAYLLAVRQTGAAIPVEEQRPPTIGRTVGEAS